MDKMRPIPGLRDILGADLWTGAVWQARIRLEDDLLRPQEAPQLFGSATAKRERHQRVVLAVALQHGQVLVGVAVARRRRRLRESR